MHYIRVVFTTIKIKAVLINSKNWKEINNYKKLEK